MSHADPPPNDPGDEPAVTCETPAGRIRISLQTGRYFTAERLQFLRSVVEQSIDGLAVADLEGNVVFCNTAFAGSHGYRPDEVTGKHLSIFHHPGQMAEVDAANRQVVARGCFEGEVGHLHRDGHTFPATMRNTLLRDDNGDPVGIIGTLRNISAQKRLERQLELQRDLGIALSAGQGLEETLRLCLDAALTLSGLECGGIYIIGDDGAAELRWHAGVSAEFARRVARVEPEVVLLQSLQAGEAVPGTLPAPPTYLEAHREEGLRGGRLFPLRHGGGLVGQLVLASRHLDDVPGEALGALETVASRIGGAIVRAHVGQRQRESEARFRGLFENSQNGIVLMQVLRDSAGEPVDVMLLDLNPALQRYTGISVAAGKGARGSEMLPPDSLAWALEVAREVLSTGRPWIGERFTAHWGMHMKVAAFSPEDGQMAFIFTDITELKQTEAALREHQERLAELVAERTVELERANRELRERSAELLRSNEELSQYAYVASHDLQAPLRHVRAYLELLREHTGGALDERGLELLSFAQDGAGQMRQMVSGLLALSRVDTHALPPEPVGAGEALDRALANLRDMVEKSGLILSRGELPVVRADRLQLVQLFQNLLENAIRFRGAAPARVSVLAAEAPDGTVRISVRDEGIGLDPRFGERIFRVFQRLHTQEQIAGTGIGLAICKKIVERHGGRIWVESRPGEGATFHFVLPQGTL